MPEWASARVQSPAPVRRRHRLDAELVARAVGCPRRHARVLATFLGGASLVDQSEVEVRRRGHQCGVPAGQLQRLLALREVVLRWQRPADSSAPSVTSPREALLQFQDLRRDDKERFSVLYVNTRNQPLACETVAVGGLNVAALQPREVFEPALRLNAAAVILAHNHPSGDPTPSPEDLAVTRHLRDAGRLLGIEVLDHLVVSADRFRSLRESGGL